MTTAAQSLLLPPTIATMHAPYKYANQVVGGIRYSMPVDNMLSWQKIIGETLLQLFRVELALINLKKDGIVSLLRY